MVWEGKCLKITYYGYSRFSKLYSILLRFLGPKHHPTMLLPNTSNRWIPAIKLYMYAGAFSLSRSDKTVLQQNWTVFRLACTCWFSHTSTISATCKSVWWPCVTSSLFPHSLGPYYSRIMLDASAYWYLHVLVSKIMPAHSAQAYYPVAYLPVNLRTPQV